MFNLKDTVASRIVTLGSNTLESQARCQMYTESHTWGAKKHRLERFTINSTKKTFSPSLQNSRADSGKAPKFYTASRAKGKPVLEVAFSSPETTKYLKISLLAFPRICSLCWLSTLEVLKVLNSGALQVEEGWSMDFFGAAIISFK